MGTGTLPMINEDSVTVSIEIHSIEIHSIEIH